MFRWTLITTLCVITTWGCGPEIGDNCDNSLDCAVDGSRFCDFTQPDGYCLIPGCRADECPEEAVCVSFGEGEQARTFCMRFCASSDDCRGGYLCLDPMLDPSDQMSIIDDAPQGDRFCIERVDSLTD